MKRLISLLMALCLVIGSAVSANALEVKVSGQMDYVFGYNKGKATKFENLDEERTRANQRARINVELIASENLRGVLQFQLGTSYEWGGSNIGKVDGNGATATVRRAYIDWNVPDTDLRVKMGLQQLTLPFATFDNPMFNAHVGAVVATAGLTDNASLTAFWARPWNNGATSGDDVHDNLVDSFGLVFDYSGESFSISPWLMYSLMGNNSGFWEYQGGNVAMQTAGDDSDHFAFGLALEIMPTDAFSIKFDGMYGSLSDNSDQDLKVNGYLLAMAIEYELDWGTPGIIGWYASGDDADDLADNEVGRMPVIGTDSGFNATRMGFSGAPYQDDDSWIGRTGVGTLGIGLRIADMSFAEDLSHTFRLVYIQGTNDNEITNPSKALYGNGRENIYLTTDDSAIEVNFDSTYKIYENLSIGLELGYIYLNADHPSYDGKDMDESAYSAQVLFHYGF